MKYTHISIVASQHDLETLRSIDLPVGILTPKFTEESVRFADDSGEEFDLSLTSLNTIAFVSCSDEGKSDLELTADAWQTFLGIDSPRLLELPKNATAADKVQMLTDIVKLLSKEQTTSAARATRFMKELAVLRQQHEENQASFHALEQFVYNHSLNQRALDISLPPTIGPMPLMLSDGQVLTQRLLGQSVGLSDIALYIGNEAPLKDGILAIVLASPQKKEKIASWEIPAKQLKLGWLRLSLERALGPDPVTLLLEVHYAGEGHVKLNTSIPQPEERFQPKIDQTLHHTLPAMQIYRWLPGVIAPIPSHAYAPSGGRGAWEVREFVALNNVLDLNAPEKTLPMFQQTTAVLAHVERDKVVGGILEGIVNPGLSRVKIIAETRNELASNAEYKIALAPRAERPEIAGDLPYFEEHLTSGWVALSPMQKVQLQILVPQQLYGEHDLYILARLPEGNTRNDYGWTTFSDLSLTY